jgi:multisubunit Na+/H+ antiporter MnhF subunit
MSLILILSFVFLGLSFLVLAWKTFRGVHILDRVLALDLLGITGIALFIVLFCHDGNSLFLDLATLLTFVSFVTALVFSVFLPEKQNSEGGKK